MFSYYFQGLALRAATILPLDPQNVFVMNQDIHRQYRIMTALLCVISDLVLIYAGVFGDSVLLVQSPWLLMLVTWGGVAFLLWYGFDVLKTAMSSNTELANARVLEQGRWKAITTMLTVTWLNPHVYLDTFAVLGNLGGQLDIEPERWFALRTTNASFLQFFDLAILAAWLALRLRTARSQRIISLVVECVMWFITLQLARDGIAHARALFSQALSDGKIKQKR